jgi:phospholipid/cholesterol/gamma-HCH transport system substrate-binding protein
MARSRKHEIGVGILVVVAVGLLAVMSLQVGALRGLGEDRLQVTATLDDAAGLGEGAAVKVAGVDIGTIEELRVEHDKALLVLSVDAAAGLRTDAVVQVRARSVLGEKYLSVTPTSADAPLLVDGGALVESRPQTEIDQLVNALGPMVEELDTDAMNVTLRAVSAALAEDPDRPKRMLRDGEEALHNLAVASRELGPLVIEARSTLTELRELSREARPVLRRADEAVTRLSDASAGLPETAKKVDLLVDETRVAVGDGRRVLGKLEANTADIDQVLKNLKEIDKVELRRLLREEGILVRVREHTVDPAAHP